MNILEQLVMAIFSRITFIIITLFVILFIGSPDIHDGFIDVLSAFADWIRSKV